MSDRMLVGVIALWCAALLVLFLAWASHRGFDPTLCDVYRACGWRYA